MAKTDQELAQDILDGEGINWRYGGDTIAGALMPFRREVLAPEQSQFIGYDDRGQAIIQNIPAQYGETQFDLSYSPAVQSIQGVGSALRDVFFGDANTQAKAVNQAVSTLRGVAGGIADYASGQYQAAMGGGTIYDPSTREVTEFDPTAVLLSNAPAGIQAVRNAPPNTMTLGAAGGRMNPPRDIHAEVASAKAAYDSNPNNEELRRAYMALRRERDEAPPAPSIVRGKGSSIPVYHGSPHKFNQFSMDSIGTGEGAQAYGYGLYFADSPDVARSYRDQLSVSSGTIDGRPIMDDYNVIIDRADNLPPASAQLEYDKAAFLEDLALTDDVAESISRIESPEVAKWARREVSPKFEPAGYTYEANLNVTPEDLLDLDAPLSQQPKKVQDMWQKFAKSRQGKASAKENGIEDIRNLVPKYGNEIIGEDIRGAIYSGQPVNFNHDFSSNIAPQENKMTSEYLQKQGIKGIRYLNGKYRGAGEGPRNYVIFDDSLIDTKRVNDQPTESWMNPEARMQRAQEGGFDTSRVAYRGLSGEYDPSKAGNYQMFTSSPEDAGEYGSSVVPAYLNKGNNLVVEGGRNNFNSIPVRNLPDAVRANLNSSVGDVARTDDIAYAAQLAGYDSVSINNVFDKASNEIPIKPLPASNEPMSQEMIDLLDEVNASGMLNNTPDVALPSEIPRDYEPATIDIIFDPKNIRSTDAEFDPTKADSSDLLSSVGATSALRGIV